jgi:hypothetical protein
MRTSGGSHRLRRDMSGGGGADFVANLPTRALEFEARAPARIDLSKILPENRTNAIRKVFEVLSESREGKPGDNLRRAFVEGLEESEKTHDSTVSTDDGSAQLAFLNTVGTFPQSTLSRLCGASLVKQTSAKLNLRTDQDYGDAGAEYAAATSSSFGIDFSTPQYAGFFSYVSLTKETVDRWKQEGGCLIVVIGLSFVNQYFGHSTHAFFASPTEPGIYFDPNNSSTGKIFRAEYNSVERILGEFGLKMTGIACPRISIQDRDHLCRQWSTWSAWLAALGISDKFRLEVLQDLGMVGLLAFAKMAVDDLFPDAKLDINTVSGRSDDPDGTERDGGEELGDSGSTKPSKQLHYPFIPYTFPPLDLVPGRNAEVSGSIDEDHAILLSRVHWLRRAHQFIGRIKTKRAEWEANNQMLVAEYANRTGNAWPWGSVDKKTIMEFRAFLMEIGKQRRGKDSPWAYLGPNWRSRVKSESHLGSEVRAEKIVRSIRRSLTGDGSDDEMTAFVDAVEAGDRPSSLTEDEWAQTDPDAPKASLPAIMRIVRLPPDYVEALFPAAARFDRLYGAGVGAGA